MAEKIHIPENHIAFCRAVARLCREHKMHRVSVTYSPSLDDCWPGDIAMHWNQGRRGAEAGTPLRRFCARLAAMGRDHANGVSLQFERGATTMLATWRSVDIGEMKAGLDATVETTLTIGFQHHYILAALDALRCDAVTISTRGRGEPVILATAGELTDPSTTIIIMPMRV